jgi:hypothetical protein
VLRDCILTGNDGGAEYGVWINNYNSSAVTDGVRVQNCDISGFYTTNPQDYGAEIFVAGGAGLDHVSILENTLHGAAGPTSPDDNGLTGYGGSQPVTNCLYQGNTVYDIGGKADGIGGVEGNGMIANGASGCTMQYNVVHDIGGNTTTCGGPAGLWTYASDSVVIQFNEVYNVRPVGSGGGGCAATGTGSTWTARSRAASSPTT